MASGTTTVRDVMGTIDDEYDSRDEALDAIRDRVGNEGAGDPNDTDRETAVEAGEETGPF